LTADDAERATIKQQATEKGALVDEVADSLYIYTNDADGLRAGLPLGCCARVMFRLSTLEDVFLHLTGRVLLE